MSGSLRCRTVVRTIVGGLAVAVLAASCGGDDDSSEPAGNDDAVTSVPSASTAAPAGTAAPADTAGQTPEGSPGAGGAGSLVFGAETIPFDGALCFLQEQDAAAGGGKILFVAQAFGTDVAGEEVMIDVSRYDEDSDFTGDKISVVFGDPTSPDVEIWEAEADLGTVDVAGSTVRASDLTLVNFDAGGETPASFEVNC